MLNSKLKLKHCGKKLLTVSLMFFLIFPMYGEPLTEPPPNSSENETRFYSDLEVETLIAEITEAALEAIEQAAAEGARAAALAALEREAAAINEAQRLRIEAENARRTGIKNAFIAGLICFAGGLVSGLLIRN